MKQFKKRLPDIGILIFSVCLLCSSLYSIKQAISAQPFSDWTTVATGTIGAGNLTVGLTDGAANVTGLDLRGKYSHLLKLTDAYNIVMQGFVVNDQILTTDTVSIATMIDGTTRNWTYKGTGFNVTTTARYDVSKVSSMVASGSINAGEAKLHLKINHPAYDGAMNLSAYHSGGHVICFYNTTGGYAACAYISATAPTGEVLNYSDADEIDMQTDAFFVDNFFTADQGSWTKGTGWTIAGGLGVGTAATGNLTQNIQYWNNYIDGVLVKFSFDLVSCTSGTVSMMAYGNTVSVPLSTPGRYTVWYTVPSGYPTGQPSDLCGFVGNNFTGTIDNVYWQELSVPIPSVVTTGALLLSSKGGSGGWLYKHASFNPNNAMTYKVFYVGN